MKVGLCQLNPLIGDLAGNAGRALAAVADAARDGAELIVLPELTLLGYPPLDLLDEPDFIEAVGRATRGLVRDLADAAPGAGVVLGALGEYSGGHGKTLENAVLLAEAGRVAAKRAKSLLPTYDVFDEARWFRPAADTSPVPWRGRRLGLTVCEDIWNDTHYWPRPLYARDPVAELVAAGADLLINVSASPWHLGRIAEREAMLAATAKRHGVPLVMTNQVGGNDELIFDGSSCVARADGTVAARAPAFEEAVLVADLAAAGEPRPPAARGGVRELRRALVLGLSDYLRKTGFSRVLLGLSGGIDSAVVACLAAEAVGGAQVEAVLMPSRYSSRGSVDDARALARNLGLRETVIPIEPMHATFLESLAPRLGPKPAGLTEDNLQARVRAVLLMAVSNAEGGLLLATGNKSELSVGYSTLYGDLAGGLAVIGDCTKTWVRELAADYNSEREVVPPATLDKPPSAELRPFQVDADDLPPYALLDQILTGLIERRASVAELVADGLPEATVLDVRRRLDRAEFKRRQAPPILRVSPRAFGQGRRLPIARGRFLDR